MLWTVTGALEVFERHTVLFIRLRQCHPSSGPEPRRLWQFKGSDWLERHYQTREVTCSALSERKVFSKVYRIREMFSSRLQSDSLFLKKTHAGFLFTCRARHLGSNWKNETRCLPIELIAVFR